MTQLKLRRPNVTGRFSLIGAGLRTKISKLKQVLLNSRSKSCSIKPKPKRVTHQPLAVFVHHERIAFRIARRFAQPYPVYHQRQFARHRDAKLLASLTLHNPQLSASDITLSNFNVSAGLCPVR